MVITEFLLKRLRNNPSACSFVLTAMRTNIICVLLSSKEPSNSGLAVLGGVTVTRERWSRNGIVLLLQRSSLAFNSLLKEVEEIF